MPEIPCPAPQPCPRLVWTDEGYVDPPGGACDECDGTGLVDATCLVCGDVSDDLRESIFGDLSCPACRETADCPGCGRPELKIALADGSACVDCEREARAEEEREREIHERHKDEVQAFGKRAGACRCGACKSESAHRIGVRLGLEPEVRI